MAKLNNIKIIGDKCEDIFLDYLKNTGKYNLVNKSDSAFDMQKDIIAIDEENNRHTYELKARTVIRKYHAMPLDKTQWYKADTCKHLVFSNIPTNYDEPISFYEVTDKENDYTVVESFGSKKAPVRMYDLHKMKKLFTIDDPEIIKEFCDLSISYYRQT